MKIIIATDTYYPNIGGAAYFAQRLASALQKDGHTILVIAASRRLHSEFFKHKGVEIFGPASFPFKIFNNFRLPFPFFLKMKIKKVMKNFKPDIVHIQGHFLTSDAVYLSAKDMGVPVVGTSHFLPENVLHYFHLPAPAEKLVWKIAWKQLRGVFDKIDFATTPTQTAIQQLRKIGFARPVTAISCGIDLQRFNKNNDGRYLKTRYSIPDKPVLLYVGRLDEEKKLDDVLRAVAVALKNTDFHFVIAGVGCMDKSLKELVRELEIVNSVSFIGFVPDEDLPNLYPIASCFVIAGMAELQSIVTLEALASGLPVIAVNFLALPELVKPGENGYLFEPKDIGGLSQYITKILSDENLRKKMSEKSLEIIKAHDFNETVRRFESIYSSLKKI